MIWIFSDIYHPTVSGAPFTIDYLADLLTANGFPVGLVTVGSPTLYSSSATPHLFLPTRDNVNYHGEQLAEFTCASLCSSIPSSPDDLYVIATVGGLGLAGLALARQRQRPSLLLHLSDMLRYPRFYPRRGALMAAAPKFAYLLKTGRISLRDDLQLSLQRTRIAHNPSGFGFPLRFGINSIYSLATRVVALSQKSYRDLVERVGLRPDCVQVIPSGIPLPEAWKKPIHTKPRPLRTLELLYVGRLTPEKNIEVLVDSIYVLAKQESAVHLTLVGGGDVESSLLSRVNSLGLNDMITFTGVVPRYELADHYRSADLLVFPSLTDTQGLVWLEAGLLGLPTLYLDPTISPLSSTLGGFVMFETNAVKLAAKINHLSVRLPLTASERSTLVNASQNLLASIGEQWLALVGQVLVESR